MTNGDYQKHLNRLRKRQEETKAEAAKVKRQMEEQQEYMKGIIAQKDANLVRYFTNNPHAIQQHKQVRGEIVAQVLKNLGIL